MFHVFLGPLAKDSNDMQTTDEKLVKGVPQIGPIN